MADKAELIITALQQRIGEIVSNYETQVAILRAEINQLKDELRAKDLIVVETMNSLSLMEQEKNSVKSKKTPLEKTKQPTKELIKDAGSF
jgi:hypothetical protein